MKSSVECMEEEWRGHAQPTRRSRLVCLRPRPRAAVTRALPGDGIRKITARSAAAPAQGRAGDTATREGAGETADAPVVAGRAHVPPHGYLRGLS